MIGDREPKDFRLARRAYEAFWAEQPQIWFDQLAHEYQMRWVNVVREVIKERAKREVLADVRKVKSLAPLAKLAFTIDKPKKGVWKRKRDPNPITSIEEARKILAAGPPLNKHGRRDYTGYSANAIRRIRNAMKYVSEHKG